MLQRLRTEVERLGLGVRALRTLSPQHPWAFLGGLRIVSGAMVGAVEAIRLVRDAPEEVFLSRRYCKGCVAKEALQRSSCKEAFAMLSLYA